MSSEGVVFGGTQPFGQVLAGLQTDLKAGKTVEGPELARRFVDESHRQPMASLATATLSAFDLEGMQKVGEAVGRLHDAGTESPDPGDGGRDRQRGDDGVAAPSGRPPNVEGGQRRPGSEGR